jgi:hypothetical protein
LQPHQILHLHGGHVCGLACDGKLIGPSPYGLTRCAIQERLAIVLQLAFGKAANDSLLQPFLDEIVFVNDEIPTDLRSSVEAKCLGRGLVRPLIETGKRYGKCFKKGHRPDTFYPSRETSRHSSRSPHLRVGGLRWIPSHGHAGSNPRKRNSHRYFRVADFPRISSFTSHDAVSGR